MTNDELIGGFERGTLSPGSFHHREHVRLTWLYLARHGRAETERRLLAGLRDLAARAGKPDKFNSALTRAWVARIADAAASLGPDESFDELLARRPDLLGGRQTLDPAQTI
jgi:hypothetical protein